MLVIISYAVACLISLGELWYLMIVGEKRKITNFALLFLTVFVSNVGYFFLSISKSADDALLAVKFTYFAGTFGILFLLKGMNQVCGIHMPKVWYSVIALMDLEIIVSVFTSGYCGWHYKSVQYMNDLGFSYLIKEYGPHHIIYTIVLIINMLLPCGIVAYAILKKTKISWIYIASFSLGEIIMIAVYFTERILGLKVDCLPWAFIIFEAIILFVLRRLAIYDVSQNYQLTLESMESNGYTILSPKQTFIGCNNVARKFFPELDELEIDHPITHPFFVNEFGHWIKESLKHPVEPKYYIRCGEDVKVTVQPFYSANGRRHLGYLIQIAVDTMTQQYIRQLKESKIEAEKMAEEAERANKSKSEFLASMSHEIRTPLNAILGFDEIIQRESSDEMILGYSQNIKRSAISMLSLVNDLLDLSKIEAGKMELVKVDFNIADILGDAVGMTSSRALAKNLEYKINVDPSLPRRLRGDEVKIREIIMNILTNALKYTKEGSVTLNVSYKKASYSKIAMTVSVTDTGIGMKPETISHLFTPYERLDQVKNRFIEGTGLGMSITQNLLTLMDTKLEVESVYGKGSTFSFTLLMPVVSWDPIGAFEDSLKASETSTHKYSASFSAPFANILVVDDTELNLEVFSALLKETKVQITQVLSGLEAVELCKSEKFDAIYLDHLMPNMDGVETLNEINSIENGLNKDTPKVAMTANVAPGARDEYLAMGFSDYLPKPVTPIQLERQLVMLLPTDKITILQ